MSLGFGLVWFLWYYLTILGYFTSNPFIYAIISITHFVDNILEQA